MKKKGSSKKWLARQRGDVYVKRAQSEGLRSRAVYKLSQLQEKYNLFKPGQVVVELGAAPGGWTTQLLSWVGKGHGRVLALDRLAMDPIDGVEILQADFDTPEGYQALLDQLDGQKADWVISDMSPNFSGCTALDMAGAYHLAGLALELAESILHSEGEFLVKLFQGAGFEAYCATLRQSFKKVNMIKPKASRSMSREVYALARGYLVK